MRVSRHDLFTVAPGAWADVLAARSDLDGLPHIADWAKRGWPVIARRRHPGEALRIGEGAHLAAGLPLPPAAGKRRIGLAVLWEAAAPRPPVGLADARAAAPRAWHPTIDAVLALAARSGMTPNVFGGLLWQSLTGLPYLSATSDLDLLWPGPAPRRLLDGLAAIEAAAPTRLDGEVLLSDGTGVNWRELHEAPPEGTVLAKGPDGVALVRASSFVA